MGTIKTPMDAVVKNKSYMSAPKQKEVKGLGNTQAVENKEGQDSGVKKKRLHAVEALHYPK
jgi:hypothetical protein